MVQTYTHIPMCVCARACVHVYLCVRVVLCRNAALRALDLTTQAVTTVIGGSLRGHGSTDGKRLTLVRLLCFVAHAQSAE
jgi:hypothetical protein